MASDPAANDLDTLLAHAAWLRGLARSLVGDRAAADDLVQDTWVAALRRPPDGGRPLRPWLRKVLTNAVRLRWRGAANRAAREHAAGLVADDAVPSSEQLLERHETQQLLARLVTELAEPYRAAILLRYAEGLTPADIARRLGVADGTVRWRLHEGLARLRIELDARNRGDRRTWIAALAPLTRGLAMTTTKLGPWIALAIAVIAVIAAWGVLRSHAAPDAADPGGGSSARGPASATTPGDPALGPGPRPASGRAPGRAPGWIAQDGAPARRVAGRVVVDGAPAAGVAVQLTSQLSLAGLLPVLEQRTTAGGAFDFGLQRARELTVSAAVPGKLAAIQHVDLRDPTARPAPDAIELVPGPCLAGFWGKVTDASGTPIARAQLLREDAIGTTTDAAGAYELCVLPVASAREQLQLVVRAGGFGAVMIEAGLPGRIHHDFVLRPEATVTGRAVTRDGQPVPHARIWIDRDDAERWRETETSAHVVAASDDDGRFRLAGVSAGRHRIGGAGLAMTAATLPLIAAAGSAQDVTLVMDATGIVSGRVVRAGAGSNSPVAGARITVADGSSEAAVSQLDGTFVLDRVPPGDVRLTASPYRVRAPATLRVAADARNDVVLEVEPLGLVRGMVRRHGVPVPGARVCAAPRRPPNTCSVADPLGRYELAGLAPGDYAVFADDTGAGAFVRDVKLTLALGEQRELALELAAGARITGTVSDRGGAPAAGVVVRFTRREPPDTASCVSDTAGRFDCASMAGAGGGYDVAVYAGPDASAAFAFAGAPPAALELADGDARIDGVRLVIDGQRQTIRGAVIDASGAPVGDARVRAWGDGREPDWLVPVPATATDPEGAFQIAGLAPGRYAVEVRTLDGARRVQRGIVAGGPGVTLMVDAAVCRDPALGGAVDPVRTAIVSDEPRDIAYRPPGRVVWNDQIELIGWNLPSAIARGTDLEVAFYYRVLRPPAGTWKIFLHLAGPGWHNADHEPGDGQCPTSSWRAGDVVVDRFTTRLAADKAAGSYEVRVGFFTGWPGSWTNLPISEAPSALRHPSDGLVLTTIAVE